MTKGVGRVNNLTQDNALSSAVYELEALTGRFILPTAEHEQRLLLLWYEQWARINRGDLTILQVIETHGALDQAIKSMLACSMIDRRCFQRLEYSLHSLTQHHITTLEAAQGYVRSDGTTKLDS